MDFLSKRVEGTFENGLFLNWQRNTRNVLISRLQQHVKTHQSLEEYVAEFSNTDSTSPIMLKNLKNVFFRFFEFLAVFSFLFIVHYVRLVPRLRAVLIRTARRANRFVRRTYGRLPKVFGFRVRIRISRIQLS